MTKHLISDCIESMLTISTAHVTEYTCNYLRELAAAHALIASEEKKVKDILDGRIPTLSARGLEDSIKLSRQHSLFFSVYAKGEFGWFINLNPIDFDSVEQGEFNGLPPSLAFLMGFLCSQRLRWVCLDRDAPVCGGLPIYNWENKEAQTDSRRFKF